MTFTDIVKDQKLHFVVKHGHISSQGVRVMVVSDDLSENDETTEALENGVLETDRRDSGWVWLEKSPHKVTGDCVEDAIALFHKKLSAA